MPSADNEVQLHFRTYYHQNEAMEFFLKDKENIRIFSYENPSNKCPGSRKYIAADLFKFAKWYLNTKKEIRNFYEIIPLDTPCRLYFDIEYSIELNPTADSMELFSNFCNIVKELLKSEYNIEINIDESFLILDSSTSKKFSLHVIVHLPGKKLFSSNVEMKKFTDFLYINMLERNISLVYNGKINNVGEKIKVPIFDYCVYTKNRNFRIYLSCKLGKDSYLKLSEWCQFYKCKNVHKPTDAQVFFDSLCVPRFYNKYDILPQFNVDEEIVKVKTSKARVNGGGLLHNVCKINNNFCDYLKNGYGRTSNFPLLEEFIVNKNKKYNSNADIRAWDIIKIKDTGKIRLIFHIKGCRYCFNIGREHKSNHIYWEIYFDPELVCHQKCFDRECHGRASIGCQAPTNITQEVISKLTEMGLYQNPSDSYVDSFWNMERDNVTLFDETELGKTRKRCRVENDGEISNSIDFKIPKILDDREESPDVVKETSFDEEEADFIVVDGKIPEKPTEYLKFIISTPKSNYRDSFEFSPTQLSNYREPLEFSIQQNSNCTETSKFPLQKEHRNNDSFEFSPTQPNEEEGFITDDESGDNLIHLSSYDLSEADPFNDCFINSTISFQNDSTITTKNHSTFRKDNICIVDKHGEVDTVLESSFYTSDSNSSNAIDNRYKETNNDIEITKIHDKPKDIYCYKPPKTFEEMKIVNNKYKSSDKCKSPFRSPVIGTKRGTLNIEKLRKNPFYKRITDVP
uniref:DNA-directed primase/polymerase protein n=1 Tax=Strongyloides papillosus TaxID=174720 RepID=A0A0N5BVF9_STREA